MIKEIKIKFRELVEKEIVSGIFSTSFHVNETGALKMAKVFSKAHYAESDYEKEYEKYKKSEISEDKIRKFFRIEGAKDTIELMQPLKKCKIC